MDVITAGASFLIYHRFPHTRLGQCDGRLARQRISVFCAGENFLSIAPNFLFDGFKRLRLRPPWYSTDAQMTPPALVMKSGRMSVPRSWKIFSASGVKGILAP